jgi:hypothetical protein
LTFFKLRWCYEIECSNCTQVIVLEQRVTGAALGASGNAGIGRDGDKTGILVIEAN